jgi:hypothetical protein
MAQRYDRPLTARADARAQLYAPRCCPGAPVGREIVGDMAIIAPRINLSMGVISD